MTISFTQFYQASVAILTNLAQNFPTPTEVGFHDLFPESENDISQRQAHVGSLAFLRHEDFIAHDIGSASSFILTQKGLSLFNQDITEHIKNLLSNHLGH
jgi:hypothetical protein